MRTLVLRTPSYCDRDNAAQQNDAVERKSERRKSQCTFVLLQQTRLNIWKIPYCDIKTVFSAKISTPACQNRYNGSPSYELYWQNYFLKLFTSAIPKAFWRSVIKNITRTTVAMDDIFCDSATFFTLFLSDFKKVQRCSEFTDLFSTWSPETASTWWHPEDRCYPGEKATRWGAQWLVLPWQAAGGGPGAPGFRTEGPSRHHLQAEQRHVSANLIVDIENCNQPN